MAAHHRTRPADPTTPASTNRDRSMVPVFTTEMYEAAFSTQGSHPMGGVAMARTLAEARQQLADMMIFADPTAPATAEIIAFYRGRTVIARHCPQEPGSGERDVPDPDQRDRRHRPPTQPQARGSRLHPHLAPRLPADPR